MTRTRLLIAAGTCALLILIIVTSTGGFTLRAGPLYFAAHNWRGPLLLALIAFGSAALAGRAAVVDAATGVWRFVDTHALALAIGLAASAAGVGIAYGTYAASGADASGYISEAELLSAARIAADEPLARRVAWPNATWAFAPLGYRPGATPGELVPTYPAGLPLSIAPVRLVAGELAAYLVVPLLGALAVICTYALGARLHSRPGGVAAAALLVTSPVFLFQIVQPMSDVAVTAWWALALIFALSPVPGSPLAAGAASGLAVLTRPNLAPLAAVVALVVSGWPGEHSRARSRPQNLLAFAAGLTPAAGALALMQWRLYGSPFFSGYGSPGELFTASNIAPNLRAYAARLLHGEAPALVIAAISALVLSLTPRGRGDHAPPIRRLLVPAVPVAAVLLACYLPYAVFAEWSYLRFLLPAFPLSFVLVGALLVNATMRVPPAMRGVVLLAALTLACSLNIVRAQQEQAFNLRRYESRYRAAGNYLEAALPPAAVVVAVQESGSVRYYAHVPILRWDQLGVDIDAAIAAMRAIGRHPVLLVEDWEARDLLAKFPASAIARLDWPARAEFGDETRVRLFDPVDRDAPRPWAADRVH